jgi:diadenosine tetraphosphate (Ap4A) HIT family hydrolase
MGLGIFKWKTRWNKITTAAFVFVACYFLAILVTQPEWTTGWGFKWPDWLRDTASAILVVAITILSIAYSEILTNYYTMLTGFGISEVREDRRGADSESTDRWMRRISGSNETTIVGTLSRGWFVVAYDNLENLLNSGDKSKLNICLLDPFGKVWRSKIESGQDDYKKFLHEANQVFWNLRELVRKHPGRVVVRLYDSEPISCVLARGAIYLGLYLPLTSRKTIPEFRISSGSFLGNKVSEAIGRINAAAPCVKAAVLEEYRNIMVNHSSAPREEFWNDAKVYCDFCKEQRHFPSELSRRYPALVDGGRIAAQSEHFFVVPTLGQLVDDHALIVTREHVTSSAKLQKDGIAQLAKLMEKLIANAESQQKKQLFFEHGVPVDGTGHGGCGICHCHVHTLSVPSDYNPLEKLQIFLTDKNCKFETKSLKEWAEIGTHAEQSYLSVQVGKESPTAFVFKAGERIESQLMRQFLAANCPGSREQWDWRKGGLTKTDVLTAAEPTKEIQDQGNKGRRKEEDELRASCGRLTKIFA